MEFNEVLIQLVRDSPSIYDSRSSQYKDQKKRENAWQNIGQCTGQSVESCMKRWKSLRDRFAKEKRKFDNAQKSGGGAENLPVWEHYEALKFLQDHLRHKLTFGNFSQYSCPAIDFTQDETAPEDEVMGLEVADEESDSATHSSASVPTTSRKGNKRKRSDQTDYQGDMFQLVFQENILDMLRQNRESISQIITASNTGQQNDQFSYFGNFVASSLRNMPQAKAYESIAVISQHLAAQHSSLDAN